MRIMWIMFFFSLKLNSVALFFFCLLLSNNDSQQIEREKKRESRKKPKTNHKISGCELKTTDCDRLQKKTCRIGGGGGGGVRRKLRKCYDDTQTFTHGAAPNEMDSTEQRKYTRRNEMRTRGKCVHTQVRTMARQTEREEEPIPEEPETVHIINYIHTLLAVHKCVFKFI